MKTIFSKATYYSIIALIVFSSFSCFGQSVSAKGTVEGSKNKKIYLFMRDVRNKDNLLDSIVSVNDKFVFTRKQEELNVYTITIDKVPGAFMFIWDGNVEIVGDSKTLWESQIIGSPLTNELIRYNKDLISPVREKLITLSSSLQTPTLEPAKRIELEQQRSDIVEDLDNQTEKYIKEHPSSFYSLFLLNTFWERLEADKTKKVLETLSQKLQEHSIAKAIRKKIELKESINGGKAAPDFTASDLKGKEVSLSKLKGRYVLLDFWGSWCNPCIKLIPETKAAFQKYQDKNVQFLGVAYDKEKDKGKLSNLIEKHEIAWPQIFQDQSDETKSLVVNKYLVTEYPSVILIDPQGNIMYRGTGQDGLVEACKILDKVIK